MFHNIALLIILGSTNGSTCIISLKNLINILSDMLKLNLYKFVSRLYSGITYWSHFAKMEFAGPTGFGRPTGCENYRKYTTEQKSDGR